MSEDAQRHRAPAFQFYPGDHLLETLTLTLEQDGALIRCLMHQWVSGALPADDIGALSRVLRVTPREAAKLWPAIMDKFVRGADGLWRFERLEAERAKQARYREAQALNGRRGGRPKKAAGNPTLSPLESARYPTAVQIAKPAESSSVFGSQSSEENKTYTGAVAPQRSRAMTWRQGLAIGHAVIEECPDRNDWTAEFKARCREQGLNYGEQDSAGRPMFARALEAAESIRQQRASQAS